MPRWGRSFLTPSNMGLSHVSPTVVSPTFDAVGAGGSQGNVTSVNIPWTHVVGSGATCILVAVYQATGGSGGPSATIGSIAIPQIGSTYNYTTNNYMYWYGLMYPPRGSQTVTVAATNTQIQYTSANSVSYSGVSKIGTLVTSTGSGSTASQTVSGLTSPVTVANFLGSNGTGSFSAYNQNSRWNNAYVANTGDEMLIGDATISSGSSISFSATLAVAYWASLSIPLYSANLGVVY